MHNQFGQENAKTKKTSTIEGKKERETMPCGDCFWKKKENSSKDYRQNRHKVITMNRKC